MVESLGPKGRSEKERMNINVTKNNKKGFIKSPFRGGAVTGGLKIAVTVICLWYVSGKIDW